MITADLVAGFESCNLPNHSFRHEDHVRVMWAYLHRMPLLEALQQFRESLRRFAAHHGKPMLYHETITFAYAILIHERIQRSVGRVAAEGGGATSGGATSGEWEEFCRENGDLLTWKPSILERYYQPETLASDLARRVFLFPDKILH